MSQYDKDLKSKLDSISESFIKGEKNGALTVINRLMKENRVHQYTHGALIGAINIIGDELRVKPMTSKQYEAEAKADHLTENQF